MAKNVSNRAGRDRWGDWLVVLLLVVAVLLGWAVMILAEGRQHTFVDSAQGLTFRYPQGWLLKDAKGFALEAVDPTSGEFATTYQVRISPIETTGSLTSTLSAVLSDGSLMRAQTGTAYRLLDIVQGPQLNGQPTMEATYAFVHESKDPFEQRLPIVVQGLDVAVPSGSRAGIYSLLASSAEFEHAKPAFLRSVRSAVLGGSAGASK